MDSDISRAGLDPDERAASIEVPHNVVAIRLAVDGQGRVAVDVSGADAGVQGKAGVCAGVQGDGSRTGCDFPLRAGLPSDGDVSRTGFGFEAPGNALQLNVAAAGPGSYLVGMIHQGVDVSGARMQHDISGEVIGFNGPGAGAGLERRAEVRDVEVSGAGAGLDGGPARRGDDVIDGNVVVMRMLADFNAVAVLHDGRMVRDLADALFGRSAAAQPIVGCVDVADDVNRPVRPGSDVDVSRAGADIEGGCSVDVESLVESALGGEESRGGEGERENGGGIAKVHRVGLQKVSTRRRAVRFGPEPFFSAVLASV